MNLKHLKRQNTWVKQCEVYIDEVTPPMDGQHSLMQSLDVTFSCGNRDSMTYYFNDMMFAIDVKEIGKQWYDIKWTGTEFKCRPAKAKEATQLDSEYPDWVKISDGKCRHGYIVAEIRKNGIESFVVNGQLDTRKLRIIKSLAEFCMEKQLKQEN